MDAFVPCDACGMRSYVTTVLDTGLSLTWCAHHYEANAEALIAYTVHIVDMRHVLHQEVTA